MVCTTNDLLGWEDFPKGLRVLLLDDDVGSAAEIRSKLEQMDYLVSAFYDEREALSVILNKSEVFHVAFVQVSSENCEGRFKFLETAKDLPTIMISSVHCLTTMMKCIALGAVEFLQKPLSEEKLKNIWQHVVRKAFNAGGADVAESLKPIKESLVSMLKLHSEDVEKNGEMSSDMQKVNPLEENNLDMSSGNRYPAPSTPQLQHGERSVGDANCHDQSNFSAGKDSEEQDEQSNKSVETTCGNSIAETAVSPPQRLQEDLIKEELESPSNLKNDDLSPSACTQNKESSCLGGNGGGEDNGANDSSGNKASRKKIKVDWTPDLHKKFVQAVEQLGVDQAIPSRILELMKIDGLTRHNVASHLQKYRMHQRHILPKEDDRRWVHARESTKKSYYPYKPIMAFPPYHCKNPPMPSVGHVYPAWGSPGGYPTGVQMWSSPYYSLWQPLMHADAWGCPVMPLTPPPPLPPPPLPPPPLPPPGPCPSFPQAEEVIDKVVKEAISKPWLPLPLGLKPPSTESVLTELTRQGIPAIPPGSNHKHHRHC